MNWRHVQIQPHFDRNEPPEATDARLSLEIDGGALLDRRRKLRKTRPQAPNDLPFIRLLTDPPVARQPHIDADFTDPVADRRVPGSQLHSLVNFLPVRVEHQQP